MIYFIFSVRLLSVLRGHSVLSSPPQRPIITEFEGFLYTIFYRLHLFSILILERKSHYFPFQCWVLNKVTIFITDLVWRGPWLGIEHGTARTQCQHSTTRLSRRRYTEYKFLIIKSSPGPFSIRLFCHLGKKIYCKKTGIGKTLMLMPNFGGKCMIWKIACRGKPLVNSYSLFVWGTTLYFFMSALPFG